MSVLLGGWLEACDANYLRARDGKRFSQFLDGFQEEKFFRLEDLKGVSAEQMVAMFTDSVTGDRRMPYGIATSLRRFVEEDLRDLRKRKRS